MTFFKFMFIREVVFVFKLLPFVIDAFKSLGNLLLKPLNVGYLNLQDRWLDF